MVLGVAAIVSSVARPPDRGGDDNASQSSSGQQADAETASPTEPGTRTAQPTTVRFESGAKPPTRTVEVGQPATVLVDVETASQVAIPSLGVTDTAEPLTPAMFELLVTKQGTHEILAQPAGSDSPPAKVGTLKVVPAS